MCEAMLYHFLPVFICGRALYWHCHGCSYLLQAFFLLGLLNLADLKKSNTVPAGYSDQFSLIRLMSLNPIKVAKPKVLFIHWSSKIPEFLVKPKMIAKPKGAKPSGHCNLLLRQSKSTIYLVNATNGPLPQYFFACYFPAMNFIFFRAGTELKLVL